MDARKLAAALREAAAENETWRGSLLSVANAISKPAVHWIGPFEHHGGKCPLPPDVQTDADTRDGIGGLNGPANMFNWGHSGDEMDIVAFSYAADNAEGWLPRPEGWSPPPPEKEDFTDWTATHIRLLPRRKPTLDALIQAARERGPMTDAERQAQRESYVRGEMGIGSDRDEAAFRAANTGPELTRNHDFGAGDAATFSPMEESIWNVIKRWDISRGDNAGYAGATGDDVRAIADAVRQCFVAKPLASIRKPTPIPADVRDVVREALERALDCWGGGSARAHINDALAALGRGCVEGETVGYSAINRAGMITGTWQPHQKELAKAWLLHAPAGSRIVRLVAEPE